MKAIDIAMLDIPQKDFTEIKFETKVGRMMAFTMTKIRNHVIQKINDRATKLRQFKLKGLDAMLSIDILQEWACLFTFTLDRPKFEIRLWTVDNWTKRNLKKSFMKEEHWLECSYRKLFTSISIPKVSWSNKIVALDSWLILSGSYLVWNLENRCHDFKWSEFNSEKRWL